MGTFSWVYVLNMFFNWSLWWGQLSLVVALNVCTKLSIPVDPPGGSSGKSWGYCWGSIILCCVGTIKSNWIPLSRIGRNHPVITIHQTHDNQPNNCGDISPKHWLSGLHWGQFNSIRCMGWTQSCRTVLRLEHYRWGHVLTLPIVSDVSLKIALVSITLWLYIDTAVWKGNPYRSLDLPLRSQCFQCISHSISEPWVLLQHAHCCLGHCSHVMCRQNWERPRSDSQRLWARRPNRSDVGD